MANGKRIKETGPSAEDSVSDVAEDSASNVAEDSVSDVAEDSASNVAEDSVSDVAEDSVSDVARRFWLNMNEENFQRLLDNLSRPLAPRHPTNLPNRSR
jgi:uncharacterized protein (DUF1778 family)